MERPNQQELVVRSGEHNFALTTIYLPSLCRHCGYIIVSFSSAVQCTQCQLLAHLECASSMPNACNVSLKTTPPSPAITRATASTGESLPTTIVVQASTSFNRHNILKEGKLLKMARDSSWNTVWAILKGEALYIFRPENMQIQYTTPLTTLMLTKDSNWSLVKLKPFAKQAYCFDICINDTDYHFAASSNDERREWMEAIENKDAAQKVDETKELEESFMFMSCLSKPGVFGWEEVALRKIKTLDVAALLLMRDNYMHMPFLDALPKADLNLLDESSQHECTYFRTKMDLVANRAAQERLRLVNAKVSTQPLPASFPPVFLVVCRFKSGTYRIDCQADRTLFEIMTAQILTRLQPLDMSISWITPNPEGYVVRLGRVNEYVFDTRVRLSSLDYVRKCIARSRPIEIDVIEYEQLSEKSVNRTNTVADQTAAGQTFCSVEDDEALSLPVINTTCYSIDEAANFLQIRIRRVGNFSNETLHATNKFYASDVANEYVGLFVVAAVYHGGELLGSRMHTQSAYGRPVWDELLKSDSLKLCDIPREARICFTFYACLGDGGGVLSKVAKAFRGGYTEYVPLGWVNFSWVDFRGMVKSGTKTLRLWPPTSALENPLATSCPNFDSSALFLVVEFDTSAPYPIIFTDPDTLEESLISTEEPNAEELKQLYRLVKKDALYKLAEAEKLVVWKNRYYLKQHMPEGLPKLLLSGSWQDRSCVKEMHKLIANWPALTPLHALELLDVRFPDTRVRNFGVNCLRVLSDRELVEFLPQLVQVLKSETYHYCALAEFLLVRAIRSIVVAHPLFWHFMSELHQANILVRFRLYIEVMILGARDEELAKLFKNEYVMVNAMTEIALEVKKHATPTDRRNILLSRLESARLPSSFGIPNNVKFEAKSILVNKCRVMDSFTKPLWLVYRNKEGHNTQVIFKAGDDLRTDILVLQMMRLMDELWQADGLDLHMQPYQAVSTGDGVGMIEVVTDSETYSAIQQQYGGGGALSAFTDNALSSWLRDRNTTETGFATAIENFTLSCAGYCVATYILGVGDRHNDNIMCSYTGNMFHIDFGYFLGQRVTFVGIPRETTPFVLTYEFANVMGGPESANFRRFVQHCCKAYNIIRKNGHLFITLFAMMLSSGIEQIKSIEDLHYLREVLHLDMSDEEAAQHFTNLIRESLSNRMVQINNAFHIQAHPTKN